MAEQLPRRTLGKTGVSVTALGLGGAPVGDLFEKVSDTRADEVVQAAYQSGVRLYDTAPWYGHGLSEHRIGRPLRWQDRGDFVVSTKVGRVYTRPREPERFSTTPWVGGLPFELRFDYSYEGVLRSYEDSLQRLGLNRVDMLVIHDLDSEYHEPEQLALHRRALEQGGYRALEQLKGRGEIRGIGAGINDHRMMQYFLDRFELDFFLVAMPYTLLDQSPLETDFEACRQRGIGIVIGAPLASGILATGAVEGATYAYQPADAEILERTRRIQQVCDELEVRLPAAALQFPLAHPCVAAVIPGATQATIVTDNVRNLLAPIPAELWQLLKAKGLLAREAPVPEPGWQEVQVGDGP